MNEIDKFAQDVSKDVYDDSPNYGSIIITLMIISIIVNTLRLMMSCNLFGRNIEDRIKNPGRLDKILLKKAIKNKIPPECAHLKDQIQEQILSKSKNLSSVQIQQMAEEAKNAK